MKLDERMTFPRLLDLPFALCVAALQMWWRQEGVDSVLTVGHSRLMRPAVIGDAGGWTVAVELGGRGARRRLPMELQIHRWSESTTLLDLIPRRRVWPSALYFRAGHALQDELRRGILTHSSLVAHVTPEAGRHAPALPPPPTPPLAAG